MQVATTSPRPGFRDRTVSYAWVCEDCGSTVATMHYRIPTNGRPNYARPHRWQVMKHTKDTGCLCRGINPRRVRE